MVDLSEREVRALLEAYLPSTLAFHNLEHTLEVVKMVKIISKYEHLDAVEEEIVTLAAWFHDVGHIADYEQHEQYSQLLAADFLERQDWPPQKIDSVCDCIAATELGQLPESLPARILCDADLAHLAAPDYFEWLKKLRNEWLAVLQRTYSNEAWMQLNLEFLQRHQYFTNYGKDVLTPAKQYNIRRLTALHFP